MPSEAGGASQPVRSVRKGGMASDASIATAAPDAGQLITLTLPLTDLEAAASSMDMDSHVGHRFLIA